MPYTDVSTPAGLVQNIRKEIEAGLPNATRQRLDGAKKNLAFYNGQFDLYPVRKGPDAYQKNRFPRYSLVMQRVINTLAANLYREGPKRTLPDHKEATAWLDAVYRANCVDALFQRADQMSMVNDVAAFQVTPSSDPTKPVRLILWDGSQFCTWEDPEDSTRPVAVVLLDEYNEQRRARLYTAEEVLTFLTTEWRPGMTAGGTAYHYVGTEDNELGFLPFTFVPFSMPLCDFWVHGPGSFLANCNDGVNLALTQNFDSIRYNLVPILVGKRIGAGWTVPKEIQPGDVLLLPGDGSDIGDQASEPDLDYLQADSSFVAASWDDLEHYLDHTMQMCGVPPSAIRMTQESVRSGVAIVAEQIPLLDWARGRQRPFSYYEDALAKLVLRAGEAHLGKEDFAEYRATASQLAAAAADPGMRLRWPKMYPDLPGVEQDQGDQWLLDNDMASRTQILMRRESYTREEAYEHLEETAEDKAKEQELFGKADLMKAEHEAKKLKMMTEASVPVVDDGIPGEKEPTDGNAEE